MGFLPVAGAEHDDLGPRLEALDVLAPQLAHVDVQIEEREVVAGTELVPTSARKLAL